MKKLLAIFFCMATLLSAKDDPYICGDDFKAYCDWVYDGKREPIKPSAVLPYHTVFVKTDILGSFFQDVHPGIQGPYILVTQNSDDSAPGKFARYLDHPKLIAWFAINVDCQHPKLHPIPIGLANPEWPHGNKATVAEIEKMLPSIKKSQLSYLNITVNTHFQERSQVYQMFKGKPFVVCSEPGKSYRDYLLDVASSKFVFSPRGNGIDCHRTWEALLLGAIPIIRTCSLDPLYEGLPVLIVQDWSEVTEEFLEKKWAEMKGKTYQMEKVYFVYWEALIESFKARK